MADQQAELSRRERTIESRLAEIERQEEELSRQQALHAAGRETARQLHLDTEQELAQRQAKLDALRQELTAESARLAESGRAAAEQREAAKRELSQLKRQADERQQSLEREAADLAAERATLDAAVAKQQQSASAAAQEREALQHEMTLLRKRADERLAALERERATVLEDQERTEAQRRRIAEQFKRERALEQQIAADRLAELDVLASQGRAGHDALVEDLRKECAQLGERLQRRDEQLSAEITAREQARAEYLALAAEADAAGRARTAAESQAANVQVDVVTLRQKIDELEIERDELRDHCQRQAVGSAQNSDGERRAVELAKRVTAERDELSRRLAEAEQALAEAHTSASPDSAGASSAEFEDLTQRYEMAVRDIRDLKKKNEDLERKCAAGSQARTPAAPGATLDWEARKRQLLASLEEDDGEEPSEERREERTRIEDVVRETDAALRQREQEIEELRRQLAAQPVASATAIETAAAVEFLDKDEILKAERARIKELQTEWESKLRQAEIDISLERAQIARAQADLAERQRTIDDNGPAHDPRGAADGTGKSKKAPRGRWLSRLGLTDEEQ